LQQLEQRSRLYLSLGPGEKVMVSHTQSLDARHSHAAAAVCNQATLETIQAAAEAASLEISVIEPALSALNRAVTRLPETPTGAYLLVHLNPSGVEVGVCHEGQLLLDYRPSGRMAVSELPALLETHLSRLSRHVGRHLRAATPTINRIYLCGESELVQAATKQFGRQANLEVLPVRPADVRATWQLSEETAGEVSAAALGALLATYFPAGATDAPNLMKHLIDRKRQPLRPMLVRSALPLAATLLLAAMLGVVNSREEQSLQLMRNERDVLAVKEARATELRLQLMAAKVKLNQLEKLAAKLPGELGDSLVVRLAECMPNDVWFSKAEIVNGQTIRLHGASYQEAGVYDFVRWLEQAPGMTEVALKGTSPSSSATGPTTSFELELTFAEVDGTVDVESSSTGLIPHSTTLLASP
jgi:Tfp pilus assembly protein PilN